MDNKKLNTLMNNVALIMGEAIQEHNLIEIRIEVKRSGAIVWVVPENTPSEIRVEFNTPEKPEPWMGLDDTGASGLTLEQAMPKQEGHPCYKDSAYVCDCNEECGEYYKNNENQG